MSAGPHDVRAHLVSLFYAGDRFALGPVLAYGNNYLRAWCNAAGVTRSDEAIRYAAADGLMRLYRPRDAMPTDDRAKLLHMRAQWFRQLCNLVHKAYRRRLIEGAERFIPIAMGSEDSPRGKSDGNGFRESDLWNPMEARTGRPQHLKSVPLKIGQRSPAAMPRVLPRVVGQQLHFDWAA